MIPIYQNCLKGVDTIEKPQVIAITAHLPYIWVFQSPLLLSYIPTLYPPVVQNMSLHPQHLSHPSLSFSLTHSHLFPLCAHIIWGTAFHISILNFNSFPLPRQPYVRHGNPQLPFFLSISDTLSLQCMSVKRLATAEESLPLQIQTLPLCSFQPLPHNLAPPHFYSPAVFPSEVRQAQRYGVRRTRHLYIYMIWIFLNLWHS